MRCTGINVTKKEKAVPKHNFSVTIVNRFIRERNATLWRLSRKLSKENQAKTFPRTTPEVPILALKTADPFEPKRKVTKNDKPPDAFCLYLNSSPYSKNR